MLKNPFETEEQTTKPSTEETTFAVDLEKTEQSKEENPPLDFVTDLSSKKMNLPLLSHYQNSIQTTRIRQSLSRQN